MALILDDTPSNTVAQAVSVTMIARRQSIRSIIVVTSPLHSRRAVGVFRRMGLDVVSAPGITPLTPVPVSVAKDHVAGRLGVITEALYEYAALGVYWWKGWI